MNDKLESKHDLKFVLLSSHDSVVALILSALGLPQNEAPPFATALLFELWTRNSKPWVRLTYNDHELDLHKYCYGRESGDKLCEFELFKAKLLS